MEGFVDTHTHILPRFDDGSRSSSESLDILRELYSQGARGVIATPHFYARRDEPDEFVKSRRATAEHLVRKIEETAADSGERFPSVYLGAEVEYFSAMSICPTLDEMCISGTRYLLCEMPFDSWTEAMMTELLVIKNKRNIIPVIAHIERYFSLFKPSMLDEMIASGFLIQSNAEAYLGFGKGKALKLLSEGKIHLLGSDSHNMEKRAPNMAAAFDVIEKKLGAETVERLCRKSIEVFKDAKAIYS
jgi:protein-tyrosine phosphatase